LHIASLLQSEGHETVGIARALLESLRHLIVLKTVPSPAELIPLSEADLATLHAVAALASLEEIYGLFHVLSAAEQTLRHASNPFLGLEMTLVRMACIGRVQPLQSILEHLQQLETTGLMAADAVLGEPSGSGLSVVREEGPAAVRARPASNGRVEGVLAAREAAAVFETAPAPRVVPEAPLSTAPQSAILTTAEGLWEALQQHVTERRPALGGPMQHGRPLALDAQRLVVGFAKQDKFSLEYLLDPEHLVVVRDTAQMLLGRPCHIVLEMCDEAATGGDGAAGTRAVIGQETGAVEEMQRQKNELKQAAIDIFGATPI
jgi:hypothetical protein